MQFTINKKIRINSIQFAKQEGWAQSHKPVSSKTENTATPIIDANSSQFLKNYQDYKCYYYIQITFSKDKNGGRYNEV